MSNMWRFIKSTSCSLFLLFLTCAAAPIGSLSMHKLEAFNPIKIAVDGRGDVWMINANGSQFLHLDSKGRIIRVPMIGRRTQVQDIARGSDGNIWFVSTQTRDGSENFVGEVNDAGSLRMYRVKRPRAYLTSLALGKDGLMWFTEFGAQRVGNIDEGGVIREVELPERGAAPRTIVSATDGAVWTTGIHYLFRISLGGAVRSYRSRLDEPVKDIASSGSSLLWVTSYGTSSLMSLRLNGMLTTYSQPLHRFGVSAIGPGNDGIAIAYDIDSASLARISPSGHINDWYVVGTRFPISDVVQRTDGAICFVSEEGDAYGCLR